eukprot:1727996-Rhodomonas_salina.3
MLSPALLVQGVRRMWVIALIPPCQSARWHVGYALSHTKDPHPWYQLDSKLLFVSFFSIFFPGVGETVLTSGYAGSREDFLGVMYSFEVGATLCAYALATQCLVLTQSVVLADYAIPTRCPVLIPRI